MKNDTYFNNDLYIKIRNKRKQIGLPICDKICIDNYNNVQIYDFIHNEYGKIESAFKQWIFGGWVTSVIVNFNESHCNIFIDGDNSIFDNSIIDMIRVNKNRYKILN